MIDILVYLFENYSDFSAHPEGEALARKLSALGFDELDISAALDWLAALRQSAPLHFTSHGLRVFTAAELERFEPGCLDFLIFLERAGVIDAPTRELILDRAADLPEPPIALERFKIIVLMVLWWQTRDLDPLIVEELLADGAADSAYH
ncbi:MAG: DUF494 domain-containing protein [Azovibrio sp.]|nr:DUF494 domain-containing protein [Azovibrio sp.]